MEIKLDEKCIEAIVQANIQAAVAQALGRDPAALVAKIVDTAMAEKEYSYDRESIFQKKIRETIREEAQSAFRAWLTEQRPAIAAQIRKALGEKSKSLVSDVAAKLVEKLQGNIRVDLFVGDQS
jgi:hypothetical protein